MDTWNDACFLCNLVALIVLTAGLLLGAVICIVRGCIRGHRTPPALTRWNSF